MDRWLSSSCVDRSTCIRLSSLDSESNWVARSFKLVGPGPPWSGRKKSGNWAWQAPYWSATGGRSVLGLQVVAAAIVASSSRKQAQWSWSLGVLLASLCIRKNCRYDAHFGLAPCSSSPSSGSVQNASKSFRHAVPFRPEVVVDVVDEVVVSVTVVVIRVVVVAASVGWVVVVAVGRDTRT